MESATTAILGSRVADGLGPRRRQRSFTALTHSRVSHAALPGSRHGIIAPYTAPYTAYRECRSHAAGDRVANYEDLRTPDKSVVISAELIAYLDPARARRAPRRFLLTTCRSNARCGSSAARRPRCGPVAPA